MHRSLYVILAIAIGALCGKAQSYKLFSSDHYLSSSLIKHMFQDSDGMLWISTEDGLNRYDGVKFTIYKNIPGDSTTIASNFVNTVFEDSEGRRFVGTNSGVQQYFPDSNRFGRLLEKNDGTPYNGAISNFVQRRNGDIWCLGNDIMLLRENNGKLTLEPLQVAGSTPLRLIGDGVEDYEGNMWITRGKHGVTRIDRNYNAVDYIKNGNPHITNTIVDGDGHIFFAGQNAGLYTYDRANDCIRNIITTPPLNYLTVVKMARDDNGDILLATDGAGLKRLDPHTYKVTDIPFGSDKFDYRTQKVHQVLYDSTGNMWLAIFQKGAMLIPPVTNNFHYIGNRSLLHNNIGSKCVLSMIMDDNGSLWVGTDGESIYNLDKDNNLIRHYDSQVPPVAMTLFEDSAGNMWVGSYGHGTGIFDRKTGTFRKVTLTEKGKNNFEAKHVYSFVEDKRHNVWIGTMGSGLFRYDPAMKKAVQNPEWADSICQWITSLYYSPATDVLYMGTYDGLNAIHSPGDGNRIEIPFQNEIINCITGTEEGILWIGTSNGLVRYNPADESRRDYSIQDGLPSSTVYAIEEHDRNLWISTNMGLTRFDIAENTFCNYYVDDGLQGNEFYKGSSLKDRNGNLYFGGINGITYFNPDEITVPGRKWNVRIIDMYLHGRAVTSETMSGRRKIIDGPVYNAKRINLSHSDNSFSIELSTHELNRTGSMQFVYSIDGSKWETLPHNTNIINFSELNPGEHLLKVKATDNGIESDETTIIIDVAHPWWTAWWMKLIYIIALAGIASIVWLMVRRRINDKREKMEQKHAEEIYEAKLRFFTNISHEIRTPMSLVISPLKKLMETDDDTARQKEYRLIQRNANRILRLINELMDIRKIDKNQMKLRFTEIEIVPFINDLCETFYPATRSKNITLNFHTNGHEGLKAWVDKANFDKIIMNLLSNAVKYTPDGGSIDISVNTSGDNGDGATGNLIITVADTGIGIPEQERRQIFERFYQAGGTNTGGTGVGLHLTNSLVKLHHGTITVDDNTAAGKGSVFTVTVPLGNSHLNEDELVTDSTDTAAADDKPVEQKTDDDLTDNYTPEERKRQKGQKVLVVEDDEEIREYIIAELSKYYSVTGCSNGREALESIFKSKPDLVVSDVMMPETDGLTLTRKIKQNINLNDIPVILLTAKTTEQDNIEGLENGADAYITKPFNIKILQTTVENLLRSHNRLRNVFSGKQSHEDKLNDIEVSSDDERLMERVMKVMNANIGDPNLTVEMLANNVGLSRVHLHRKLKELTNQSPRDFIRNTRLQMAAKLLAEKRLCIAEIAYATGFKNPNNFSTAFKELYGISPTEYAANAVRPTE